MSTVREFLDLTGAFVSDFLIEQLERVQERRTLNHFAVIDEIRDLEARTRRSATKPSTQFTRGPLKGLWHKHFSDARFIPRNIINQWQLRDRKSHKFEEVFEQTRQELNVDEMTDEFIDLLAYRFVNDGYLQRAAQKKLTGEWIIYAKHKERNYYLAISTHTKDINEEECLYRTIRSNCEQQFPFLFLT